MKDMVSSRKMRPLPEAEKAGGFEGVELAATGGFTCSGRAPADAFDADFLWVGNALSLTGQQTRLPEVEAGRGCWATMQRQHSKSASANSLLPAYDMGFSVSGP